MNEQAEEPPRPPDPRMIPPWQPPPPGPADPYHYPAAADPGAGGRTAPAPPGGWWDDYDPGHPAPVQGPENGTDDMVIRPFLLTGGRTRPTQEGLFVETLIQSDPQARTETLRFEARRIVEECRLATSVAELSSRLRLPLGVIRVLVSDLVAEGLVTIVQREELSVQMIERIRDRVRAL